MNDLISRQDAQERQRVAQKRRYTFGNDEFSLEAAYHDCKLVFDGITDDDSFQEADTGLILYYANEIIYALHEALKGKGTNVHSNDYISRQAAIEALEQIRYALWEIDIPSPTVPEYIEHHRDVQNVMKRIDEIRDKMERLPSAQPEPKTGHWIPVDSYTAFGGDEITWIAHGNPIAYHYCSECKNQAYALEDGEDLLSDFCPSCGAKMLKEGE